MYENNIKEVANSLTGKYNIDTRCSILEEFEDTKGVTKIRRSKNRQHNDQNEKRQTDKRSTKRTRKTKYRVTRTPLKTGGKHRCSGRVNCSCSTSNTRHVNTGIKKKI